MYSLVCYIWFLFCIAFFLLLLFHEKTYLSSSWGNMSEKAIPMPLYASKNREKSLKLSSYSLFSQRSYDISSICIFSPQKCEIKCRVLTALQSSFSIILEWRTMYEIQRNGISFLSCHQLQNPIKLCSANLVCLDKQGNLSIWQSVKHNTL